MFAIHKNGVENGWHKELGRAAFRRAQYVAQDISGVSTDIRQIQTFQNHC